MEVYVVLWVLAYEGNQLLGVFSTLDKAKSYVEDYRSRNAIATESDSEWVEIRKVELDKVYKDFDDVGEEV